MLPFKLISDKPFDEITAEEFNEGQVLLVDKPLEWSSFQVVNKLKFTIKKKFSLGKKFKIGHAGTLDPLASGLLIICTGKKTKSIEGFQDKFKEYSGTITVGATTASFDLETEVEETFDVSGISNQDVLDAVATLTGEIKQYPPVFSAVKIDGRRAYKSARKGIDVQVRPRLVMVDKFDVDLTDFPIVKFLIVCGKGTYIRSLASDLGKLLNNGAHLSSLRREAIGDFRV